MRNLAQVYFGGKDLIPRIRFASVSDLTGCSNISRSATAPLPIGAMASLAEITLSMLSHLSFPWGRRIPSVVSDPP